MVEPLKRVQYAKINDLSPTMALLLADGYELKFTVTGDSMYPFLRHGIDSVVLRHVGTKIIKKGDIVLFKRADNGQYVLHRVVRIAKEHALYLAGDAQNWVEGPIRRQQVIGIVMKVYRKEKEIFSNSYFWIILSKMWMNVLPARPLIIEMYRKSRKYLVR